MKRHFSLAGMLLCLSATTFAAGYQLNLQGLRQLAMGGGGTAIPWDAATIFYNPAGLTKFESFQAYAGSQFIMPRVKYVQSPTGPYEAESIAKTYPTFEVYLGGPISNKSPVSIGLGVYTPFGSGLKWDDNWTGRYLVQEVKSSTIFFQPTIAWAINDMVSVGAGFVYGIGSMQLNRAMPILNEDGTDATVELNGRGHGIGINLGLRFVPSENVQLGVNYRSRVNIDVKRGYATFNVPSSLQSSFPYSRFSSQLPMPSVLSFGIGYNLSEKVTFQADVNYTGWSAYQSLDFDFDQNTSSLPDMHSDRKYRNTLALRLGIHAQFSEKFAGMVGGAWDPSPVRDGYVSPELPDSDRGIFTFGLSYQLHEKLSVIGAAEMVSSVVRDGDLAADGFSGKYQTKALTLGIGFSYSL
jgi:long-chain fatty acid transport protein